MAWDGSGIFREFIYDQVFSGTLNITDTNDVIQVALYDNAVAASATEKDASAANAAYGSGSWTTTNELAATGNYALKGEELLTQTVTNETNAVEFDAADTAWANLTTSKDTYGCLVFDDTTTTPTADRGICFNYFGGAQSVTGGTFTIVWNATNGIFRVTV